MNKRKVGAVFEDRAVQFLSEKGYEIIERNFKCYFGEIDIIAKDEDTISFIEVKYRKNSDYGFPGESVNFKKQNTIKKTAGFFIKKNNYGFDKNYRFDVVLILENKIELIKNAFGGL